MDYENYLAISYYDQIGVLNEAHHVYLVQHKTSKKVFVKKELAVYNKDLYCQLKAHPVSGIPRIYELFESEHTLTVIEEYISGDTLESLVEQHGPFDTNTSADYMLQLCDIMIRLHSLQPSIIHRDIKPSNIMLSQFDHIVLLDLNAAKYESFKQAEDTMLLGTKGYAAPEQYGFGVSTVQTDIFAMGTLLKYLTTGAIHSSADASNAFFEIIEKSTQLEAKNRYASVFEMKQAIEKIVHIHETADELHLQEHSITQTPPSYTNRFLPPGFRTGNPQHMLSAILTYLMIIIISASLTVDNTTGRDLLFNRISCCIILFACAFFATNYLDVQRFFPYTKHSNSLIRILAITLYTCLVFLGLMIVMVLLEGIFFL